MSTGIIVIIGFVALTIYLLGQYLYDKYKRIQYKKILVSWLESNTSDEPGKTHLNIRQFVIEHIIDINIINQIISNSKEIYRSSHDPELISIWRKEPENLYDSGNTFINTTTHKPKKDF